MSCPQARTPSRPSFLDGGFSLHDRFVSCLAVSGRTRFLDSGYSGAERDLGSDLAGSATARVFSLLAKTERSFHEGGQVSRPSVRNTSCASIPPVFSPNSHDVMQSIT